MPLSRPRKDPVVLLTGFEPFGGEVFNPSGEIAGRLDRTRLTTGVGVRGLVLPVAGNAAFALVAHAIRRVRPFLVVSTGVSQRPEICVECRAFNEAAFRMPDNLGETHCDTKILDRGAVSISTGIDAAGLAGAIGSSDLPARVSNDAGRFVCNWLYYRLLHLTTRAGNRARHRVVFLHLPPTTEMRKPAYRKCRQFPLETVEQAVVRALEELSGMYPPLRSRTGTTAQAGRGGSGSAGG